MTPGPSSTADRRTTRARRLLLVAIVVGLVLRVVLLAVLGTSRSPVSEFGVIGANLSRGHGFTYFAAFPDQGVIPAADLGKGLLPAADVGYDRPTAFVGDPQPSAYMPPPYPALTAVADAATGTRPTQIRFMQLLNLGLFVVLAYMLFLLGRLLMGPEVGAIAALGAALYPALIYMTTQVSASNLYLPAEVAMLVVAIRAVRDPTNRVLAVAAGALVGFVSLLRPEGIVLGGLIAVMVVMAARRRGVTGPRALQTAAILVLVAAVPVGLWLARNTHTFGKPTLGLTTQAGFVLWAGNHEGATGSGKTLSHGPAGRAMEEALFKKASALPPGRTYELRRDSLFRQEAVSWITRHPLEFIAGILKKGVLLATVNPDDRRSLNPGNVLSWVVLVALAVAGLWKVRPRGPEWRLIGFYAVLSFLVPVFLVVLPRYRLPVDLMLLLPAAWFVVRHPWYEHFWARLVAPRMPAAPSGH
ncbi:MAG: glycosyltransferase family 39 protein [Actinomycetota bacterium]|nr:glycosyltransferase family 39 protein [Actinomycetota bacterium]